MKKKKVLVACAHYGTRQTDHLRTLLKEYNSFKKYEVTVHVYLTHTLSLPYRNLKTFQHYYPDSMGYWLTHEHKALFKKKKDEYDFFIYTENDVLITEENLDTFMYHSDNLKGTSYIPGFLRYEINHEDTYVYLIDNAHCHAANRIILFPLLRPLLSLLPEQLALSLGFHFVIRKMNIKVGEEFYFQVQNVHQGSYVLTKEQLGRVLQSTAFTTTKNYAGIREGAASNVYVHSGLQKVISISDLQKSLVHHLSDKYGGKYANCMQNNTPSPEKLARLLRISLIVNLS